MKRDDLEHVLRAAGAITGVSTWVIVGSQAILGAVPDDRRSCLSLIKSITVSRIVRLLPR
jgi:hypothetical protein